MRLGEGQLSALIAVIREGSFDRAARALHVTPSAISQRIKQLEEHIGGILVVRGTPCTATALGDAVHRHALQVELLERDLLRTIGSDEAEADDVPAPVTIAVNADSLATWLVPALGRFVADASARVDVVLDDQDHTADWLRSGRVLAAITSEARPVQGCRVQPLGVMRYRATASPKFVRKWFAKGLTREALLRAPALQYNRKDELCARFVERVLRLGAIELRSHYLPSPNAYVDANVRGLGWGMNPEPLVTAHLGRRRLVDLVPDRFIDVPLFWQRWSLASPTLDALEAALIAGAASLRPM